MWFLMVSGDSLFHTSWREAFIENKHCVTALKIFDLSPRTSVGIIMLICSVISSIIRHIVLLPTRRIIVRYTFDGVVRSCSLPIHSPESWLNLAVKPCRFKISIEDMVSVVMIRCNDLSASFRYHVMQQI